MNKLFWLAIPISLLVTLLVGIQMGWAWSEPPKDYPKLMVAYLVVPDRMIGAVCRNDQALACALPDPVGGGCMIWLSQSAATKAGVVSHERLHCEGWTH